MAKRPRQRLAALALALSLGACTPPEERAEQAREAVGQAIERGDREAALQAIDDLRSSAEDTADAQLELAQLLVRAGNAPEAGWLLEDATRRHPDRADLALALARVSLLLGNPARAREVADAIPVEAEQHAHALVLRAQAELQLGDLDRALASLADAERLYPDRPEARLVRIATLLSEDRKDEARTAIEEARTELSGDDEESVALRRRLDLMLAQLQAEQGETEAALAALDALLDDHPMDLMVWQALVQVLARAQRAEEALARVKDALAGEEAPAELHALAAQMHAALGDEAAAEAALRRYVERSDSAAAYQPLVTFYSARGDANATIAVLDEALGRYSDEPTLRLQRVEALLASGRIEEARAELARFRAATFEGDPQVEYLAARLVLAEGHAVAAARRLTRLAPKLDRAATQYWIGRALEESGDLEGAERRYALAIHRDPTWTASPAALLALAQRRGDWRAVARYARTLVIRAPHDLGAWTALVTALERLGEGEAAQAVAERCGERFPGRPEPHLLRARALRAQGRHDEALAELDLAEDYGVTADLAAARVRTLGMAGRVEAGVAEARAAAAAHPEAPQVHAVLASLLFAAGAADEGSRATDRALALDPDDPSPLRDRCLFRAANRHWAGARDDCTRYLEARPEDAEVAFVRGVALEQLGEPDAAIAAYRRAAALDERDARPHNNLAGLLAARGDLDGALAAAQEAYRLDEANPYIMDTLGALYLEKGLVDRAISVLEDACAGAPELADAQLHLGLAYRDAGRTQEARTLLAAVGGNEAARPELRANAKEALDSLP
jgi:tetratricopeptide (TPR) repeat protein